MRSRMRWIPGVSRPVRARCRTLKMLMVVVWTAWSSAVWAEPGSGRIDELRKQIRESMTQEPERALVYGAEALALLEAAAQRPSRLAVLEDLCLAAYRRERHETAVTYCGEGIVLARQLGDQRSLATLLRRKGNAVRRLGRHHEALAASSEARDLYAGLGDLKGYGSACNGVGYAHWRMGDYPQAMEAYVAAHDAFEEAGDAGGVGWALRNIGTLMIDVDDPAKALETYQRALTIQQELGDEREIGKLMSSMGNAHRQLGDPELALEFQLQAMALKEKVGDRTGVAIVVGFIGDIYRDLGDLERALGYYRKSLAMRREIGDRRREAIILIDIGRLLQEQEQHGAALEHFEDALKIAEAIDASAELAQGHKDLSVSLAALGRLQDSVRALEEYQRISRRMFNEKNRRAMEQAQLKLDTGRRERELELLRRRAELDASELNRQRWVMVVLALFVVFSAVLVVVKARAARLIAHQNGRLQDAMARLKDSERRYRRLFEEPSTAKLVVTRDTGEILDSNRSARELLPEQGMPPWLSHVTERLTVAGDDDAFVHSFQADDAGRRWMEAWVSSLRLGDRKAALLIVRDVTERRALERRRSAQERAADVPRLRRRGPRIVPSSGTAPAVADAPEASFSEDLQPPAGLVFPDGYWIGRSASILAMYSSMSSLLGAELSVLIGGETGVGKERVARILHDSSDRRKGPFVAVNCAAIPRELLEAEMFGIAKGVATGVEARLGQFRSADGGTLFLDEIGEMPLELQAKLLRVVQEKKVQPVGGKEVGVDVWILAATNRDLPAWVEQGQFRRDLYFRLAGYVLDVPPLRDRPSDVLPLFEHFLWRFVGHKPDDAAVEPGAQEALLAYGWPGNVRELEHEAARVARSLDGASVVEQGHLSSRLARVPGTTVEPLDPVEPAPGWRLKEHVQRVEKQLIQAALGEVGGSRRKVATLLGISRSTLARKMADLNLPGA